MTNLKNKLSAFALCAAAIAVFGGALAAQNPKVAAIAINEAKAETQVFNLVKDSFMGSIKSARGLKVIDNAATAVALKTVDFSKREKVKSAGKLLSVDHFCVLEVVPGYSYSDDSGNLLIRAKLFDAMSGEAIVAEQRAISNYTSGNDIVAHSKALASEMDLAIKKKRISDKAAGLKDLVTR
jgi:hypothetical protein